jgi:hypothetical protein
MIYLDDDCLEIRFPELRENAGIRISFQRTLRIPDDGQTHHLPPGLGRFPLRHIEDLDLKHDNHLKERGGIIMPMFQAEALWLDFNSIELFGDVDYPIAVKIGTGKICAVSGDNWTSTLNKDPQDYIVVPEQPWIDGYNVDKGKIKQFVAAPMGQGYTVEEQLTGGASVGGLQIQAFPMKHEYYEKLNKPIERENREYADAFYEQVCYAMEAPPLEMGLAPGGSMEQEIYEDPHNFEVWDLRNTQRCFVAIANADQWMTITGEEPPNSPCTATAYTKAGLPWFKYYDDDQSAVEGAKRLGNIKSIKNIIPHNGDNIWKDEPLTFKQKLSELTKKVSTGKW